jgi:hypothetical protein
MEISLTGKIILYADIVLFGIICLILWYWQYNVLRGKAMPNPDGSVDDWHDQKLCYGLAATDLFLSVPVTLAGIIMIFAGVKLGYYITGCTSFWFLWINTVTTVTSLRFEKPKITLEWIIVFPFGAILGLVYIVWSLVYFEVVF